MNLHQHVKLYILEICGGPTGCPENLPADIPLAHLGYDEDMSLCGTLEIKLQQLALNYSTGKRINAGSITEQTTVRQCITYVSC